MDITIERLEQVLDSRLEPINTKLSAIEETLAEHTAALTEHTRAFSQHTVTLDAILKQTKDWNAEMAAMRNRMERYEGALKVVANKLNIDLGSLLS